MRLLMAFRYPAVFLMLLLLSCQESRSTLFVKDRHLYTYDGQKIILRGVNEMFIWSKDITGDSIFPEIAKTGANVVRIVWVSDKLEPKASAENLDKVLTNCLKNGMIPIIELHGATGAWERLPEQVDYWVRDEIIRVLKKHERYLLINIANEAGDWSVTPPQFIDGYKEAILRMRSKGITPPLIVDAAGWGQNIDILQETFSELREIDPLHNMLFSVHIWWAREDGSTDRITKEINESVRLGMPIIVGEFAPMAVKCRPYIDTDAILSVCQQNEIGWLAWSWGYVHNKDCRDMDMTSDSLAGKFEGLQGWGREVAVDHPFSITNTSIKIPFHGVPPDTFVSSVFAQ